MSGKLSSGPDEIPAIILKKCSESFVAPLCKLFTVCFECKMLPADWICANVTPLYKGSGPSNTPTNYRPISLTSAFGKLMESCVKEGMLNFLIENNLLNRHQHGFLPKRSTLTQLLECLNEWMSIMDEGNFTDVVYIDLRKAFDSVVHEKLLQKCEAYGFHGNLLAYLRSFLENRLQRVRVGNSFSEWKRVRSGVPQGSVLGPLLFILYINDMPEVLQSSCVKMYADDAKLYNVRYKNESTARGLQRDLTSFELWCEEWQLYVNARKCKCLHIGWNPGFAEYSIAGEQVNSENTMKDLGVWIDGRLNFSAHCSKIVSSASQRVGLIYRAFACRDLSFMCKMFVTYVRPILEYNCEIWSPLFLKDIDLLERVQRRFLKKINGFGNYSYRERLAFSNLESLELRRIKRDVVFVFKIMHRVVNLSFDDFFKFAVDRGLRGNSRKLYPSLVRKSVVANHFCNRVVNVWNALPDGVVCAGSLPLFKKKLDENLELLTPFLKGRAFRNQ
jgi:ribonuclease P/MRP protein subunit RPP40